MTTQMNKQDETTVVVSKTVDGEAWKKAQKKTLKEQKAKLNLKGFRKGQVPDAVVKKHIPEEYLLQLAAGELAQDALDELVDEYTLELIDRPVFDVKDITPESVTLEFTCKVAPEPVLGQYTDLGIAKEDALITDEDVEKALNQVKSNYADLILVEDDTPAKNGDDVNIDFVGKLDGVPFEGGDAKAYDLKLGSGTFVPGFEEQIVGMKTGEEKEITVTFPEDYPAENLKGKDVGFTVKVNAIEEEVLPELTEEFFEETYKNPEIHNVEELKEYLRKKLTEDAEKKAENDYINAVVSKAVENAQVEIPAVMIDDEVEQMFKEMAMNMQRSGLNMDVYLKAVGQTPDEVKEPMRPEAANRVKTSLVLDAIARKEGLTVPEEEIDEELKLLQTIYQLDEQQVRNAIRMEDLERDLLRRKAVDFLKSH